MKRIALSNPSTALLKLLGTGGYKTRPRLPLSEAVPLAGRPRIWIYPKSRNFQEVRSYTTDHGFQAGYGSYGSTEHSTVYALSTPPGRSAVGVVRITGPLSLDIYQSLCPSKPLPKPRVATLRTLIHPTNSTLILDPSALILFFPGPNSFTGEDILELHLHGGPAVLKSVLSALPKCCPKSNGKGKPSQRTFILPAEPGEFTRRAFYNSRLSLPQIEALGDLLVAETEQQRSLSVNSTAKGADDLSKLYMSWHTQLLSARGELEALIDFSEDQQFEETPAKLLENVKRQVLALKGQMERYLANAVKGELLRNGINLALLGAPNAGKSSLLNKIVGREAAIVSNRAGTTRDVVDVAVDIDGWMVVLGDTAGFRMHNKADGKVSLTKIHDDIDDIEVEGMKRARSRVSAADVVIFLASIEEGPNGPAVKIEESAVEVANNALRDGKEVIVAINKIDKLGTHEAPLDISKQLRRRFPGLQEGRMVAISCTNESYEATIQVLLQSLTSIFSKMTSAEPSIEGLEGPGIGSLSKAIWSEAIGASSRQRVLVEECHRYLGEFITGLDSQETDNEELEEDIDIVLKAETLRGAANCLSRVMGKGEGASTVEEVLGVVFER
ncbi:hypothetical protein ABW19_dt0208829 [Dactylella cylindrospora]|nr:hypothetical protein ABW19_dt0208829 [Dactylella cylindrospora]